MTADRLDLDALAALEAAATPGDWQIEADGTLLTITQDVEHVREVACALDEPDATLIVALRNAAPALIARLREAEGVMLAIADATSGPGDGPSDMEMVAGVVDALTMPAVKRARERLHRAESERDAAQAALDATVVTARNRLDEIRRLRGELETTQAALARVTGKAMLSDLTDYFFDELHPKIDAEMMLERIQRIARGEGQEAGGK